MPLRETPLSLWPGEKCACVCTGCVTKPNHTGKGSLKQHWENSTRAAMFSESSEHKTVLFKCTVQTDCCIPMAANKTRCSLPGFRFTLFKNKIKTTPEVPFVYRRASLKLHPEKQPKKQPFMFALSHASSAVQQIILHCIHNKSSSWCTVHIRHNKLCLIVSWKDLSLCKLKSFFQPFFDKLVIRDYWSVIEIQSLL